MTSASSSELSSAHETAHQSERVRGVFNKRTWNWNRKYAPMGKLAWRLGEFRNALRRCTKLRTHVLDLGCGAGHLANYLCEAGYRVTGCDIAENMIAQAQKNFRDNPIAWVHLSANWRRLPFPNGSFGAVVASSVFEYLSDIGPTFNELGRVLKDDGVLLFNVPNPASFQRRREHWSLKITNHGLIRSLVCIVPRVRRYLTYLELSKNRYPLRKWELGAQMHGFLRLDDIAQSSHAHPLYLFAFRKRSGCNPALRARTTER